MSSVCSAASILGISMTLIRFCRKVVPMLRESSTKHRAPLRFMRRDFLPFDILCLVGYVNNLAL